MIRNQRLVTKGASPRSVLHTDQEQAVMESGGKSPISPRPSMVPKPPIPPKPTLAPKPTVTSIVNSAPAASPAKEDQKKPRPVVPRRVDSLIRRATTSQSYSGSNSGRQTILNNVYIDPLHLPIQRTIISKYTEDPPNPDPGNSSCMANTGVVPVDRVSYGKDEGIAIVMEDITNVDSTAATEEPISPSTSSTSDSSNEQPNIAVALIVPVAKARTKISRPLDSSSDSDDSGLRSIVPNPVAPPNPPFQSMCLPTIRERIQRTHPIWYLEGHINREIATYLLQAAKPGNFIVRLSSKENCHALSVRIHQLSGHQTHHFIIENTVSGKIRLKGSKHSFHSLPALVEFYHEHGGELYCNLRLPRIVLDAQSSGELVLIAKIGREYWNWSHVPLNLLNSVPDRPMINEATTSFIQPMPSTMRNETQGIVHKRSFSHQTADERTAISRSSWQRNSDHRPHYYDSKQPNMYGSTRRIEVEGLTSVNPASNFCRDHSLKQHVSRFNAENEPPRQNQRSQSVREKQREQPRKKSFLKFFSSSSSQKEHKKRAGTPDLAHCTAFQVDQDAIKRSYGSAFEVGELSGLLSNDYGYYNYSNSGVPIMKTFKPGLSGNKLIPGEFSNIGRPLPPKPGDDLCNAASALRLAKHNEGSPGPPKSPEARKAMRPPGPVMDAHAKQLCVEELRRKRLQTQTEMLNATSTDSPKQPRAEKFYRVPEPLRSPKRSHRLSVPDLQEIPTQVQESARALVSRLGRNEIGELGPINEGLITPVVRRKVFPIPHEIPDVLDVNRSSTTLSTESDNYGKMTESTGYGTIQPPLRHGHPSPSVQRKESELIWRRNSAKRIPVVPDPPPPTKSNRSGFVLPDRSGGAWSAVASELNARQAAKRRSAQNMNIGAVIAFSTLSKMNDPGTSEYTPLNELADFEGERPEEHAKDEDTISVAGTVFNEPWDSTTWDNLMDLANHKDEGMKNRRIDPLVEDQENEMVGSPSMQRVLDEKEGNFDNNSHMSTVDSRRKPLAPMRRHDAGMTPMTSMMSLPRVRSRYSQVDLTTSMDDLTNIIPSLSSFTTGNKDTESYRVIHEYIEKLFEDSTSNTAQTLNTFMTCNLDSAEANPDIVICNIRQFLTGIKNFFIHQGERDLHKIFIELRAHLTATQIVNFDAIIETILHRLVLSRLMNHIYNVKIDDSNVLGTLADIATNIQAVREWPLEKYGFPCNYEITLPTPQVMDEVKILMKKMQHNYSPLKKLEYMMRGIGLVLKTQRSASPDLENNQKVPAINVIIRWFLYIIARCSMVACEIEAWYTKELLPKPVLDQADVFYYINAMLAAVLLLKNETLLQNLEQDSDDLSKTATLPRVQPAKSTTDLFIKVAIPDLLSGKITYTSFPVIPKLCVSKFCSLVAHQMGITNPERNRLYVIRDGIESVIDKEYLIENVRNKHVSDGILFFYAYKPEGATVFWPSNRLSGLDLC